MAGIYSGVVDIVTNFVLLTEKQISFKKTLNNKGPNIDPCGTLIFTSFHALK